MSSPDINYPEQPSYGEGMAEALKAQAEFLKGTGDFADVGSLESLLPLEESIRKKTAQMDTDILRQTLLGTETDAVTGTYDDQGRLTSTQSMDELVAQRGDTAQVGGHSFRLHKSGATPITGARSRGGRLPIYGIYDAGGKLIGQTGGQEVGPMTTGEFDLLTSQVQQQAKQQASEANATSTTSVAPDSVYEQYIDSNPDLLQQFNSDQAKGRSKADFGRDHYNEFGKNEDRQIKSFAKDAQGNIITDPSKVGQTETIPGGFTGDGMVDILGDTRDLTRFETRTATQADVDAGLADEVGDTFVETIQTDDQAGFREGEFKGLATLAEDIQRGSLSRQREADLQDVSRLSGLYQDIMEDYKPGTQSAMQGAKDLIEEQKGNLLRDVGISDPAQVASQGVQADPLRQGLMTQAEEALGQGLTDRERRLIDESERARATLMGRTFDQKSAIEEAKAQVLEDNQRKMQNRAFAQSVLGQEAGIQTADDTRRMGADQFNVGTKMDSERLRESLRMQGLLGYLDAASRIQQMEDRDSLDPFQAILGRGGGTALQQGQSVFGQAGYGLQSSPQYLNPEAGLGFIQNQATNAANMAIADQAARASSQAGIFSGLGSLGGGFATGAMLCWVAREVYGAHNPAWLLFREWMLNDSPGWFRAIYIKFGERFAKFISNKPRLKARIRIWMDSKIRR